jgi:transposase
VKRKKKIIETVKESQPYEHQLPGRGWTLKKLRQWVAQQMGHPISRTTLRTLLKAAGLSWKKSKKVLAKADPKERAEFVARFQAWYEQLCQGQVRLIYVDEVHVHQDLELGYRWSVKGEADWVVSHCPPLKNRLNWYGAYDFSSGQCFIWHNGACNGDNTIAFLDQLALWLGPTETETLIIWDGASYHNRCAQVQHHADTLGFCLVQLPAYSPDLNPIEGLWKWLREDLSQHHCFKYLYQLERACLDFIDRINLDPEAIITRLWPKFDLLNGAVDQLA